MCLPPDPGQDAWIYVDTMARPQWDDWESLRIIRVVQSALVTVGASTVSAGLPAATLQPPSATLGPRQSLAQAWRFLDFFSWTFEPPSCTTLVNCCVHLRVDPLDLSTLFSFQRRAPHQYLKMVLGQVPDGGQPEIITVGQAPLPMDWLWSGQPCLR